MLNWSAMPDFDCASTEHVKSSAKFGCIWIGSVLHTVLSDYLFSIYFNPTMIRMSDPNVILASKVTDRNVEGLCVNIPGITAVGTAKHTISSEVYNLLHSSIFCCFTHPNFFCLLHYFLDKIIMFLFFSSSIIWRFILLALLSVSVS